MRRLLFPLAATALLAAAAGCDGDPSPGAAVVVHDSAGVPIVELPASPSVPEWTLAADPALTIGAAGGGEAYELFRPIHALRLDDGRIVVANQGTQELRFYGGDGVHLRTVGRRGGGPGEYEDMWGLVRLPGDSLGVWDWTARRLTVYDDEGRFGRLVTPTHDLGFVPRLVGAFDDGSFVVLKGFSPMSVFARGGGVMDDSVTLLRLARADGALLDSLGPFPGDQRYVHMEEGRFWMRRIPFGRAERLAVAGDRIHIGDDRRGEVRVYDAAGALRRVVRLTHEPAPVGARRLARYREEELASVAPDRLAEERRRLEQTPSAETVPAFTDLFADRLGRIWLSGPPAAEPGPSGGWTVHAADGEPIARIRLPARASPRDAGTGYLLLYARDELDVETIVLHHLLTETDR